MFDRVKRILSGFVAALALLCGLPIQAHHGFAGLYEMNRYEIIEVTLSKIAWVNPHVVLHATDAQGRDWMLETGPVNLLYRQGIENDTLHAGDRILARGNPGRNGDASMWLANILLPSGEEIMMAESKPFWNEEVIGNAAVFDESAQANQRADDRETFFRVWNSLPSTRFKAEPKLNDAGKAIQAAYQPPAEPIACLAPGMPRSMFNPWPIEFELHDDHILLRGEEFDIERIIWLQEPQTKPEPSIFGFSKGTLEGNLLTIETTGMLYPQHIISGDSEEGMPQSSESRIVETYRMEDNGLMLFYESVTHDPQYLDKPWIYRRTYTQKAGLQILPWDCNPQ